MKLRHRNLSSLESSLLAATSAKILCSAVFISGRDPEEALQTSVLHNINIQGKADEIFSSIDINKKNKSVTITFNNAPPRTAKFFGDQGCIILPLDANDIFFDPIKVETSLPNSKTQEWPMGDAVREDRLSPKVNEEKLAHAVNLAFEKPESFTTAFLVLYKGKIIAERYDNGVDENTQLESWSMGKSITSTLIGILIQNGFLHLEDPSPVPEWRKKDDPRSKIRIVDLLHMSSGLKFSGPNDAKKNWKYGIYDHEYVYCGAIDVFKFCINKQLEFPPNTVGRYRNCDPLTLGYIIKKIMTELGEEYLCWPQRALFDRVGIRKQILETDSYGNFIMSGYDYGTARNWARLGLLYLQDGVFNDERILPEGWAKFVSTPAPAWEKPEYGALFWVNGTNRWDLPTNSYWMSGAGGQRVIIIPSHDLVVVRMGFWGNVQAGDIALNNALRILTEAIH